MSQQDTYVKEIDGVRFEMGMLPPRKSHRLLLSFSKMVGPSIGPLADSLIASSEGKSIKNLLDLDVDLGDLVEKVSKTFFADLDIDKIDEFMDAFAEVTFVKDGPLNKVFDLFFLGRLDLMYGWFLWGIKIQWGKSVSALVKSTIQSAQTAKSQSTSQNT